MKETWLPRRVTIVHQIELQDAPVLSGFRDEYVPKTVNVAYVRTGTGLAERVVVLRVARVLANGHVSANRLRTLYDRDFPNGYPDWLENLLARAEPRDWTVD